MALAYTDFMGAGGLLNTDEAVRDVSDILHAILLSDQATLGKVGMSGSATNPKHEWVEDALNAVTFTAAYTASTNTLTISDPDATAEVQQIVRTGALVQAESDSSFMLQFGATPVTGANTMTVYEGIDADVASGTFTVVGLPYTDEAGLSSDIAKARTLRWNSSQILERTMEIAKTRKGMDSYAIGSGDKDMDRNIKNRTLEAKRELNIAALVSTPYSSGGVYSHNTDRRTMAGLIKLIRDPGLTGTATDLSVVDGEAADISTTLLNNLVYTVWDRGGFDESSEPVFIMSHFQKDKAAALNEEIRRDDAASETAGYEVSKFKSNLGPLIPIVVDRWLPKEYCILLDTARANIVPFRGDTWNMEKVPTANSRMDSYQLSGQFTLELFNPDEAHGLLRNLSVS
jgi:hypothetical protein